MKKTEVQLQIVLSILHSPTGAISESDFKAIAKSKSTFHRYVQELCDEPIHDGHPLLTRMKEGKNIKYTLNKSLLKYYAPAHLESYFYLSAYEKIGRLLSQENFNEDLKEMKDEVFHINGRAKANDLMFDYLTKIHEVTSVEYESAQSKILFALLNNKRINLSYNEKEYVLLCPLTLCQYRDGLYLVASKDLGMLEIRKFKLTRISDIEITGNSFAYPDKKLWNPEEYFKNSSGIMDGETRDAEFFNGELLQETAEFDEWRLSYSGVDEFLGQLFVYAQDVEIVGDGELKRKFLEKAEGAIGLNRKIA